MISRYLQSQPFVSFSFTKRTIVFEGIATDLSPRAALVEEHCCSGMAEIVVLLLCKCFIRVYFDPYGLIASCIVRHFMVRHGRDAPRSPSSQRDGSNFMALINVHVRIPFGIHCPAAGFSALSSPRAALSSIPRQYTLTLESS